LVRIKELWQSPVLKWHGSGFGHPSLLGNHVKQADRDVYDSCDMQDKEERHEPEFDLLRLVPEQEHRPVCAKRPNSAATIRMRSGIRHPSVRAACLSYAYRQNTALLASA
jgi:hypothetical protein